MRFTKNLSPILIVVFFFSLLSINPTSAQPNPPPEKPDLQMLQEYVQEAFPESRDDAKSPLAPEALYSPTLYPYRLAKAQPDECFNGIGQPYTGTVSLGCKDSPYYLSGLSQPKVNQAYVWGLTKYNQDVWMGTAPNTLCLVYGGFLGQTSPIQTPSYVCEFGESQYSTPAQPAIGDWRPPDAFVYNLNTTTLTNRDVNPANFPSATLQDTLRYTNTLGLRSAGLYTSPISNTVFLAGPGLTGGINLFAYDADTGNFIDSTTLITYTNIRKWINVDGYLYTGVRKNSGAGAVLKYTGDPSVPGQLFNFEEVGLPDSSSEAAELVFHDGRLFVSTWPDPLLSQPASLWMSPEIQPGGLTSADKDNWQKVWEITEYDPNPFTAALTGGGALASMDGYLYWGTMHVPFMAYVAQMQLFPPDPYWDQETQTSYMLASLLGNHRAISIFRGRDFATPAEQVELIYGEQELPAFIDGSWVIVPNNMGGVAPTYGGSGFGNFYNNYTWTMGIYKDELYVGTMDWSYLLEDGLSDLSALLGLPPGTPLPLPGGNPGADLWRIRDNYTPAEPIDAYGVGNSTNYGIRTMLVDDSLYLGTANPMNLLTDPYDNRPEGGWELVQMREIPPQPDLSLSKWDTASPAPVPPGSVFTYTLQVINYGFGAASNVTVQDTLPPGVTYNYGNPACNQFGDLLICNLGSLAAYDGFSYDYVTTNITFTAPSEVGWLVNKAYVYCSEGDAYYPDNDTNSLTLVDEATDLAIEKTASHEGVIVGQTLTYTLTITNSGPGDFTSQVPINLENLDYIYIPTYGIAYPYPSEMVYLNGLQGNVDKVTVTLNDLSHTRTSDLDIMLVSPEGTKVMLMSDAGGGLNFNTDMDLTFDDDALEYLPEITGVTSGTYRPTNYGLVDFMPPPAPIGLIHDQLSDFQGEDPNGYWQLYVFDDLLGYTGRISGGWTLNLTLSRQVRVEDSLPEDVSLDNILPSDWDCQEQDPGEVVCTIETLPVGVPSQIDLVTTVLLTGNQSFTNSASVSTDSYDPEPGNNWAEVIVNAFKLWFPIAFK